TVLRPRRRGASRAAGTRADRQVPPRSDRSLGLERLHVRGSRSLRALLRVVTDLRALGKRLEAVALDRAVVYEQVLAGVIGCDEAKALVVAEPLHSPCGHVHSLRVCALRTAEDAETQRLQKREALLWSNGKLDPCDECSRPPAVRSREAPCRSARCRHLLLDDRETQHDRMSGSPRGIGRDHERVASRRELPRGRHPTLEGAT